MGSFEEDIPVGVHEVTVRSSPDRPVRESHEPSITDLHVALSGQGSSSGGCVDLPMAEGNDPLRLSTYNDHGTSTTENQTGTTEPSDPDRTELADDYMVPNSAEHHNKMRVLPTSSSQSSSTSQQHQTPEPVINFFGDVADQLPKLTKEGYSEAVLNQLSLARRESTNLTYQSKWKLFAQFANDHGFHPFYGSPALVADFLLHVAKTRKATTSTIAGYRSAIGRVLRLTTGYDPGKCEILSQLMQSFKRTQPINAARIPCWNISFVLATLADTRFANSTLSDKVLTAKAIFLTALASGDRRSALAALDFNSLDLTSHNLTVNYDIKFIPKSYFVKKNITRIEPLTIPKITSSNFLSVCPVHTLVDYVGILNRYRTNNQTSLFISHVQSKTTNITPQSIAFYITFLVKWCYEQSNIVFPGCRSHDVRKVAASLRALSVGSLNDVLEAGNWAQPMTFIKHYFIQFSDSERTALSHFPEIIAGRMTNYVSSVRRRKNRDSGSANTQRTSKPHFGGTHEKHGSAKKDGV